MYIALYNKNRQHITNVDNTTHDLTVRVYDPDSFTAEGTCAEDINNAKVAVLNDDEGNYKYACFADVITPDAKKHSIKGLDFKTLWDTEILLDYTPANSFDGKLSAIFQKIKTLVFEGADITVNKIPVEVVIPTDNTNTIYDKNTNPNAPFGSYQDSYQFVNAYSFLKGYLKYYEYNIESYYDIVRNVIVFTFVKCGTVLSVDLSDFIHELTTTSTATNKAVATMKRTPENTNPATKYYYRDADNNIVQSDKVGNIPNRLYPVRAKWFEAERLAESQYSAVYELADARFVDNIIIDNNKTVDPIDFASYPLYTKVSLYFEGKLYKTLPISEKITTFSGDGENIKIKLGFKKILLTEIIKK